MRAMKIRESLKRGTIEMVILHVLQDGEMYGYQLLSELHARSNGLFELKEGTAYPILYRLIDKGLITDESRLVGKRRTRVYYHIQPAGVEYLQMLKTEYYQLVEGIDHILNGEDSKYND